MSHGKDYNYAVRSRYAQEKLARCYVYWLCKTDNQAFWLGRVNYLIARVRQIEQARVQAEADRQVAGDGRD